MTEQVRAFDVMVCGGGPAGIAAACAAATSGARTLLIERFGRLGGMGTSGWVHQMPLWTDTPYIERWYAHLGKRTLDSEFLDLVYAEAAVSKA